MSTATIDHAAVQETCRKAIQHTLRRIHDHPTVGWYCGWGTETFALLTAALALLTDVEQEAVQEKYGPLNPRRPYEPGDVLEVTIDPKDSGQMVAAVLAEEGYCPTWAEMTYNERVKIARLKNSLVREFTYIGREAARS